jgi:hypothetical protein
MIDLHLSNIVVHVVTGATALACGLVAMAAVKGGAAHRRAGRWFTAVGAIVLVTALIGLAVFGGPPALAAAFLAAGYQYVSGLRALALKTKGPGWIDFSLAIAGLGACGFYAMNMAPGSPSWSPAIGYGALGFTAAVIAYDLSRHFWRDAWLQHVRPFDHGVKMGNVYFAMLSAGVGNTLRDFQPWSQLVPTAVGLVVVIALVVAHRARLSSARSASA